jgi:hypothetical protein
MAALRGRSSRSSYDEPKPKNDAFTAMLIIALLAQLVAGVFLALDFMKYPEGKPPAVTPPPKISSANPDRGPAQ